MRTLSLACVLLLPVVAIVASCRTATEITLVLSTDVKCADLQGTTVTVGRLGDIEAKPFTSSSVACDDSGGLGTLVVVPSGGASDEVAVKIVAGHGRDPSTCTPPYGKGCIVARRAIHYLPHAGLRLGIPLRAACDGVSCADNETCVNGACASASIGDPAACTQVCDETGLVPADAGSNGGSDAGSDAGPDAAFVTDAGVCRYACDFTVGPASTTTSCAGPAITMLSPLATEMAAKIDMSGYATLAVILDMCDPRGLFFHFADSPTCRGVGGDLGQFSNDAEVLLSVPQLPDGGADSTVWLTTYDNKSTGNNRSLLQNGLAPTTGCSTHKLLFGDQTTAVDSSFSSRSSANLRLNPPSDTLGAPDALWYIGLNRTVGDATKTGTGVRHATLCFN